MKNKSMSESRHSRRQIGVGLAASLALSFSAMSTHAQDQKQADVRLTPADAKTMAEGLKPLLNDSADGLISVRHPDGSVSTDLQGRFQNVTVAVKDASGAVVQGCVNNTEAAAGFFRLDRSLLDLSPNPEAPKTEEPATLPDR